MQLKEISDKVRKEKEDIVLREDMKNMKKKLVKDKVLAQIAAAKKDPNNITEEEMQQAQSLKKEKKMGTEERNNNCR